MKGSEVTRDISVGKPSSVLLRFALPLILSGVFQQLYNVADSVVVGNFAGEDALAAVGASYPITMLFVTLAMGAGLGSSVVVSQYFGAKRFGPMKTSISTIFIAMAVLAGVCTAFGFIFCEPLMNLLNTPASIFDDSAAYLRIYLGGLIFLFLYNAATSVFAGLGDSKTPLYFLIFSSLFNVALDIIFVAAFQKGVVGVAWATFIAQGISALLAMVWLFGRLKRVRAEEKYPRFSWPILRKIAGIGVPNMLNMSAVSIGQLAIQALVNGFGPVVIGGYSAAIKIDSFFKIVISSMGNAMTTFTAQNIGAGKIERVNEGRVAMVKVSVIYAAASAILLFFFAPSIMGIFVQDSGSDVVRIGTEYMREVSLFYFPFALVMIHNGILRGAGYVKAFLTVVAVDLGLRVAFSYILASLNVGYSAIWWSIPIGWAAADIISMAVYYRGKWKQLHIIDR
ncbi:MAG: Multidrug resistance protein MdtK [Desulfovibrio sp.]|uniref:MATE family efflux transporter n=1 Tax=Christensenella intestinihominis TaxID=1851429 RepID=UPI0008312276|nr:MATE family efflux transporter [Christensenella intestinihominis]